MRIKANSLSKLFTNKLTWFSQAIIIIFSIVGNNWPIWFFLFASSYIFFFRYFNATISVVLGFCLTLYAQLASVILAQLINVSEFISILVTALILLLFFNLRIEDIKYARRSFLNPVYVAVAAAPLTWLFIINYASKYHPYSNLTWAMNADARNNALNIFGIKADGFEVSLMSLIGGNLPAVSVSTMSALPSQKLMDIHVLQLLVQDIRNTWLTLIFVACLLVGLLISRYVAETHRGLNFLLILASTYIVFSWSFLGRGLEGGFINAFFSLVLLICSLIIFGERSFGTLEKKPYLLIQISIGLLLLFTWAPTSALTIGLVGAVAFTELRNLFSRLRTGSRFAVIVTASVLLYSIFAIVSSSHLRSTLGEVLRAEGGFYPFKHLTVVILALAVFLLSSVCSASKESLFEITVALLSVSLMLGVMLWSRRDLDEKWGYYPLKFSWIMSMALTILIVGLLGRLVALSPRPSSVRLVSYIAFFVLLHQGFKLDEGNLPGAEAPAIRVIKGWSAPDGKVVNSIFTPNQNGTLSRFFFGYSDPESDRLGNFWSALLAEEPQAAIHWAYTYDKDSPDSFCKILDSQSGILVITSSLPSKLEILKSCVGKVSVSVSK